MNLAIEALALVPGKMGGVETAFRCTLEALLARPDCPQVTLFTTPLASHRLGDWRGRLTVKILPIDAPDPQLEKVLSPFDVVWCPFNRIRPVPPSRPTVVTIVDVQHLAFPEFFSPAELASRLEGLRAAAACATRVLAISDFTRREILRAYGTPEANMVVSPLDAPPSFRAPPDPARTAGLRERYALPERYILYPANAWPHKNHATLFRALAAYEAGFGDPPPVVLAGAHDVGGVKLDREAASAGVGQGVRRIGYVKAGDMPFLFDGAAMLVFPSLYEGFGIPVVEAFRRGVPVIAANGTSLPEIAGDAAILVDPLDHEGLAEAMHRVLSDERLAGDLVDRGKARAAQFDYAIAGGRLAEALKAAVAEWSGPRSAITAEGHPTAVVCGDGEAGRGGLRNVARRVFFLLPYGIQRWIHARVQ